MVALGVFGEKQDGGVLVGEDLAMVHQRRLDDSSSANAMRRLLGQQRAGRGEQLRIGHRPIRMQDELSGPRQAGVFQECQDRVVRAAGVVDQNDAVVLHGRGGELQVPVRYDLDPSIGMVADQAHDHARSAAGQNEAMVRQTVRLEQREGVRTQGDCGVSVIEKEGIDAGRGVQRDRVLARLRGHDGYLTGFIGNILRGPVHGGIPTAARRVVPGDLLGLCRRSKPTGQKQGSESKRESQRKVAVNRCDAALRVHGSSFLLTGCACLDNRSTHGGSRTAARTAARTDRAWARGGSRAVF